MSEVRSFIGLDGDCAGAGIQDDEISASLAPRTTTLLSDVHDSRWEQSRYIDQGHSTNAKYSIDRYSSSTCITVYPTFHKMSSARRVAAPLTVKIVSTTKLFNSYKLNSSSFTIFKSLSLIFISFSKPIIEKRSVKSRIYTEPRDAYATQIHSTIYAVTTSSAWRRQDLMRWGTVQKTAWNFLSHIKW